MPPPPENTTIVAKGVHTTGSVMLQPVAPRLWQNAFPDPPRTPCYILSCSGARIETEEDRRSLSFAGQLPSPGKINLARLDLEHFQNHPLRSRGVVRNHNAALKYLREEVEPAYVSYEPGNEHLFASRPLTDPVRVRPVMHAPGQEYVFDMNHTHVVEWDWQQMISHLDETSMRLVVLGKPPYRGHHCGIVACHISPIPGSYDHKRCSQKRGDARRLPVWAFQVVREDGSAIYMHPQWNSKKCGAVEVDIDQASSSNLGVTPAFTDVPANGMGASDGPGSYKAQVKKQEPITLRFAAGAGGPGGYHQPK